MTTASKAKRRADSEMESQPDRQNRVRWLALLILGLGLLVTVVDSSVVSVATPAMQEEFQATESQMLMVVTIYNLWRVNEARCLN